MPSPLVTTCALCDAVIDLTGRVGRPPMYCSPEHRRAGHAAAEARRRAVRRAEIERLRKLVHQYEAAAAA